MIPICVPKPKYSREILLFKNLCHMSPYSATCPNHITCESDPRGDMECIPPIHWLYEESSMEVLPQQKTASQCFKLIPGKEIL